MSEISIHPFYNRIVEAPLIPKWITWELTTIGGLTPFHKPLLILEWGGSALKWPGGPIKYIDHFEKDGDTAVRVGVCAFFLSKWWSPEQVMLGGPAAWQAMRYIEDQSQDNAAWDQVKKVVKLHDLLGPPPTEGKYQAEFSLQHPHTAEMVPLDQRLVDFVRANKWRRDHEVDLSTLTPEEKEKELCRRVAEENAAVLKRRKAYIDTFGDIVEDLIQPLQRQFAQGSRPRQGMDGRWRKAPKQKLIVTNS